MKCRNMCSVKNEKIFTLIAGRGFMQLYSKFLDIIQKIYKILMIIAMAVLTVTIIASVIWRYVLENPIVWAEQLSRFMFVWAIMLGIPIYYREGLATCLDLLVEKFPDGLEKIVNIVMNICVGLFGVFYGYASWLYIVQSGATKFQGLGCPSGVVYASELVCSVFLVLCVIETVIKKVIDFSAEKTIKKGGEV
jgi:TRAP-type C4-dicarboxylate transport system permease small subunit